MGIISFFKVFILFSPKFLTRVWACRSDKEVRETFSSARFFDLLVEFECLAGKVPAHVREYPTVGIGFPEKSRSTEVSRSMDLYAVSPQDGGAHLTGSLAAVDQENCVATGIRTTI
jgi:hypothetical protein